MGRNVEYDKKDCLLAIKQASEDVDGPLTTEEYQKRADGPGHWVINDRFGSWNKAKEAAGVELWDPRKGLPADYGYFSQVTTAEQAYWVGFIYGDGCIAPNGNGNPCLSFCLNERDRHILEEFRDTINAEHSISESGDEVSIGFVNDEITADLRSLGAGEQKTYSDELPGFERDELRSAFVRGLGDADGHCQKSRYSITGANKERFRKLSKWLPVKAEIYSYPDNDNKYRLRVTTHERVAVLREWLYPDGLATTPALSRKKKEMMGYNY